MEFYLLHSEAARCLSLSFIHVEPREGNHLHVNLISKQRWSQNDGFCDVTKCLPEVRWFAVVFILCSSLLVSVYLKVSENPAREKASHITFSRGSSQARDQTPISRVAGGFFTIWATREGGLGLHANFWGKLKWVSYYRLHFVPAPTEAKAQRLPVDSG